jgi:hypothetical protein
MKIISFEASCGFGMFDPIYIIAVLENGEKIHLTFNGRDPLTPKQFLELEGYEVNCGFEDWKWSEENA